jgi:hypothetical protein
MLLQLPVLPRSPPDYCPLGHDRPLRRPLDRARRCARTLKIELVVCITSFSNLAPHRFFNYITCIFDWESNPSVSRVCQGGPCRAGASQGGGCRTRRRRLSSRRSASRCERQNSERGPHFCWMNWFDEHHTIEGYYNCFQAWRPNVGN